jgi:DNA-binding CsgD family transcriptional regulator
MNDMAIIEKEAKFFSKKPMFKRLVGRRMQDYYGIAYIALEEAKRNFNPSRGLSWEQYAAWCISWAIEREASLMSLPIHLNWYEARRRLRNQKFFHFRDSDRIAESRTSDVEDKEEVESLIAKAKLTPREEEVLRAWSRGVPDKTFFHQKRGAKSTIVRARRRAFLKLRSVAS